MLKVMRMSTYAHIYFVLQGAVDELGELSSPGDLGGFPMKFYPKKQSTYRNNLGNR